MEDIKVGTKVSWTHVSKRGRVVSMSLREGAVTALMGGVAQVQKPSGKTEEIAVRRLRVEGQPSQIGEFVEGMRIRARKEG
jgi:hypothetical protein